MWKKPSNPYFKTRITSTTWIGKLKQIKSVNLWLWIIVCAKFELILWRRAWGYLFTRQRKTRSWPWPFVCIVLHRVIVYTVYADNWKHSSSTEVTGCLRHMETLPRKEEVGHLQTHTSTDITAAFSIAREMFVRLKPHAVNACVPVCVCARPSDLLSVLPSLSLPRQWPCSLQEYTAAVLKDDCLGIAGPSLPL